MTSKTNFEELGFYESVVVILKWWTTDAHTLAFELDNDFENGKGLKFGDVLKEARKRGYQGGTILLILESYLDGKIYRYGNYNNDLWYEVGEMKGFA